jgi:hypothetical protein
MAQVVVWARRASLDARRDALSVAIHGAVMAALDWGIRGRNAADLELDYRVEV